MLRAARRFPEPLATLLCLFIPRKLIQTRKEQFAFGVERVDKRLQQTTDRPDFSESLLLIYAFPLHPPPGPGGGGQARASLTRALDISPVSLC